LSQPGQSAFFAVAAFCARAATPRTATSETIANMRFMIQSPFCENGLPDRGHTSTRNRIMRSALELD
jgi:hypothetical protein